VGSADRRPRLAVSATPVTPLAAMRPEAAVRRMASALCSPTGITGDIVNRIGEFDCEPAQQF
jgi:hypothetical protein